VACSAVLRCAVSRAVYPGSLPGVDADPTNQANTKNACLQRVSVLRVIRHDCLAQDAAAAGQGIFVQLPGGLVTAERAQAVGEAVGGGQGAGVVLAQEGACRG
jgi:hypothetical protein